MVVFTCNNCGETLQKPRVLKHYQFQCRTTPFLTCVDCFKDFRGEEYVAHTKCITEAERYGGKNYVPKASANKGEKKQQEWINVVNNVLNGSASLTHAERGFLQILAKFDNIPRKKAKFLNFVRSISGNRTNMSLVESVWAKMETAHKSNIQNSGEAAQRNGNTKEGTTQTNEDHVENNIAENQNNENICRESQGAEQQNESSNSIAMNDDQNKLSKESKEKKKKKKRSHDEAMESKTDQPGAKKRKGDKDKSVLLENQWENVEAVDQPQTQSFDWKTTILDVLYLKGEISLKKLQKKVVKRYMSSCPDALSYDKACSKFNKKLRKVSKVAIFQERVKLV